MKNIQKAMKISKKLVEYIGIGSLTPYVDIQMDRQGIYMHKLDICVRIKIV